MKWVIDIPESTITDLKKKSNRTEVDNAVLNGEQAPTLKEPLVVEDANEYKLSREDAIEVLKDWDGYFIGHSSDEVNKALDLAIKALEHPEKNVVAVVPCGDAVSRAEVLKLIHDNWHTYSGDWAMQESMNDIRALPSVEPKANWIPLDRLGHEPENEGDYLVQFDDGYISTVHYGMIYDRYDWELWQDAGEPIAWMPLPKPYKEVEDGNDD